MAKERENWQIRKTEPEQLPYVLELYAKARTFMAEHGNPHQWGDSYPEQSLVEQDIRDGNSYVCMVEGRIAATFYYHLGEDEAYRRIEDGQWLDDKPYGVVHRITSDGQTKGAASFCLNWALEQCGNLKIDTHRDNTVMQNCLKKNGFAYCGIVHVEDGGERLAYQRQKKVQ